MKRPSPPWWKYVSNYKFRSLLIKNFLLNIVLFILPLMVLTLIVTNSSMQAVREEIGRQSMDNLMRTAEGLDSLLSEANFIAASISLLPEVDVFLESRISDIYNSGKAGSAVPESGAAASITSVLKTFIYTKRFVYSIFVFSEKSQLILTTGLLIPIDHFFDQNWKVDYRTKSNGEPYRQFRILSLEDEPVVSVIKPIMKPGTSTRMGAIVINIGLNKLRELIALSEPNGGFVIRDGNGSDLYPARVEAQQVSLLNDSMKPGDTKGPIFLETPQGTEVQAAWVSKSTDLQYQQNLSLASFSSRLQSIRDTALALAFYSLLAASGAAFVMAWTSYQPIRNLLDLLADPSPGLLNGKKPDELRQIATGLVRAIQMNQTLKVEMETQMSLLDRTRTAALQAQINPHFLYNTLDSIRWSSMELSGGENSVSLMIHDLARLLRLSMETEEAVVTLRQEIEHAAIYVHLLQVRYSKKFEVFWQIEDSLLDQSVLKLCLQPLIENAFTHGIKPTRREGVISITGKIAQGVLVLGVQDNGRGISSDRLRLILDSFQGEAASLSSHIGLANVNARIKLLFGPAAGLKIHSEEGSGTLITVEFPLMK